MIRFFVRKCYSIAEVNTNGLMERFHIISPWDIPKQPELYNRIFQNSQVTLRGTRPLRGFKCS